MKKIILILSILLISTTVKTFAQESDADFSIRANYNYQYFSFNGIRTNGNAIGGIIEKRINYESTIGLGLNYVTRMEDGTDLNANLPEYNNILLFNPFVRKYFHKALDGPYSAFSLGIGIPSETGTQWEFGGQVGYLILNNKIAIDLMIQMGFGSFRYRVEQYDKFGFYVGNYTYVDYGFFFRPGISIGLAN